jgi:DNA-directed RNA polymerase specialized sigma24 family protein
MSGKKNYVSNSELLIEIGEYQESDVMSEKLGEYLLRIADQYSSKGSFSGYTWREDMVGEAVLTCVKYLKNFNREKSNNPFAYITQICRNSFVNYIKIQAKHSGIKDTLYKNMMENRESLG